MKLPMGDIKFVQILDDHDLLPGSTKATLQSNLKPTTADKADYFLSNVERGVETNLPKLVDAMEAYSRDHNDPILRDLAGKIRSSLGKSTYFVI